MPDKARSASADEMPILDLTAPSVEQLAEMASFIERESATGIVYVHCKIGYSRTAAAVAAYLLRSRLAGSASEALDLIRRARPAAVIRPEVRIALDEFARQAFSSRPTVSFSNNQPQP